MTEFVPATAARALAMLEAAGVADARRLLADYAAAGLVRSYALVIETREMNSRKAIVRGAGVPVDLWQRVVRDGVTADVWTGGTVRLEADDLIGGLPAVAVTGIGFHQADLEWLVEHQRGRTASTKRRAEEAPASPPDPASSDEVHSRSKDRRKPDPAAIPAGAILVSVAQAGAALGFGPTKVNAMMKDGRLERRKIDGATRITVASIMAVASADTP